MKLNPVIRLSLIVLAIYLVPSFTLALAVSQSFVVGFAIVLPITTIFTIVFLAAKARRKQ